MFSIWRGRTSPCLQMNFQEFINKLQKLPDKQKKIILWVIVIILAFIMGFFWFKSAINKLEKLGEAAGNIQLPAIEIPSNK